MPAPQNDYVQADVAKQSPPNNGVSGRVGDSGNAGDAGQAPCQQLAVLVCHGMGEQVPFESIDSVAQIVLQHLHSRPGAAPPPVVHTRILNAGGKKLARAELAFPCPDGASTKVHIYEAYWAPLTAGKVSIGEVFVFLLNAGIDGFLNTSKKFSRYMFGATQQLDTPNLYYKAVYTTLLLVLLSLYVMSATVIAVGTARALTHNGNGWPGRALLVDLTADFVVYGVFALTLGLLYMLAWQRQRRNRKRPQQRPGQALNKLIMATLGLTVAATIVTGGLIVWHLFLHQTPSPVSWWLALLVQFEGTRRLVGAVPAPSEPLFAVLIALTWATVLLLNNKVRKMLIDYLGDVLAYVAPSNANKFCATRAAIHEHCLEAARAVYAMRRDAGGGWAYDRIIVLGHSLGSVVAYDVLNALFLDDDLGAGLNARGRTSHLLTFGSPLDKTAYIFRVLKRDTHVREALSANVQPLILNYADRANLTWINLWSGTDPISGALDYYDCEKNITGTAGQRVENYRDSYCNIPLFAHTMYWASPVLRAGLAAAIAGTSCRQAILATKLARTN